MTPLPVMKSPSLSTEAIRPFVAGQRLVVSDTPEGAEATTIIYSLMETAKAKNLRLGDYIDCLLTPMPERLADDPDADIDDLLPWVDGIQKRFAMFRTGGKLALTLSCAHVK